VTVFKTDLIELPPYCVVGRYVKYKTAIRSRGDCEKDGSFIEQYYYSQNGMGIVK